MPFVNVRCVLLSILALVPEPKICEQSALKFTSGKTFVKNVQEFLLFPLDPQWNPVCENTSHQSEHAMKF